MDKCLKTTPECGLTRKAWGGPWAGQTFGEASPGPPKLREWKMRRDWPSGEQGGETEAEKHGQGSERAERQERQCLPEEMLGEGGRRQAMAPVGYRGEGGTD